MLTTSKVNNNVVITYAALNFFTGKTDVEATVLDPSNVAVLGSPFTMTEIGSQGVYTATFLPTTLGNYKIIVAEGSSKKAATSIEITSYDIDSVGLIVDGISVGGISSGGYIP